MRNQLFSVFIISYPYGVLSPKSLTNNPSKENNKFRNELENKKDMYY